jgi:hypothetical protein
VRSRLLSRWASAPSRLRTHAADGGFFRAPDAVNLLYIQCREGECTWGLEQCGDPPWGCRRGIPTPLGTNSYRGRARLRQQGRPEYLARHGTDCDAVLIRRPPERTRGL